MSVKQEDHDALLLEVQRLEAELGRIRGDLQGVAGCKGKCEQLDGLQETVNNTLSSFEVMFFKEFKLPGDQDFLLFQILLFRYLVKFPCS